MISNETAVNDREKNMKELIEQNFFFFFIEVLLI